MCVNHKNTHFIWRKRRKLKTEASRGCCSLAKRIENMEHTSIYTLQIVRDSRSVVQDENKCSQCWTFQKQWEKNRRSETLSLSPSHTHTQGNSTKLTSRWSCHQSNRHYHDVSSLGILYSLKHANGWQTNIYPMLPVLNAEQLSRTPLWCVTVAMPLRARRVCVCVCLQF